jgi:hypothetical protein
MNLFYANDAVFLVQMKILIHISATFSLGPMNYRRIFYNFLQRDILYCNRTGSRVFLPTGNSCIYY